MKLECIGFSEDRFRIFKQHKIDIIPFKIKNQKKRGQENIPDWLILFDKIATYDKETNEKRFLMSWRNQKSIKRATTTYPTERTR